MGLFSKKPIQKPNPTVTWDGITYVFHRVDFDYWTFSYKGYNFDSSGEALTLLSNADLETIITIMESLNGEMRSRMITTLTLYECAKLDTGERCSVDITNFNRDKSFIVSWSSEIWGDLGVDFTIENGVIVDEYWAD